MTKDTREDCGDLGRIENLIQSSDGKVRGVCVKVMSKKGQATVIRRPIQHIYPLEVRSSTNDKDQLTVHLLKIRRTQVTCQQTTHNNDPVGVLQFMLAIVFLDAQMRIDAIGLKC